MKRFPKRVFPWLGLALVLPITGCGSDSDEAVTETPPVAEQPSEPAPAPQDPAPPMPPSPEPTPPEPPVEVTITRPQGPFATFYDGNLVAADYWSETPQILSAALGFSDIVALEGAELEVNLVRQAGGAWSTAFDCGTDTRNITSASLRSQVAQAYIQQDPFVPLQDGALGLDGLPLVFSWPMDTRTLNLSDFQLTLNTGEVVTPMAVGPFPNIENNERNIAVLFGEFGNRLPSSDANTRFPVRVEIVADDSPLMLVGPQGQVVSAVGLSWQNTGNPYDDNNGPSLVGAKLNHIGDEVMGEGVNSPLVNAVFPANDELTLYDEGDFKLRILTSGGFSPDGVRGVLPTDFANFFRLHVTGENGETVLMEEVGVEYVVAGGTLRVVGMSELGAPEGGTVFYDGCYDEDLDNYIDIILVGDEAAARNITHIEIPSLAGGYSAFFSPGGPGSTPFEGVTYTSPGPADLQPVIMALDDPMRVTYSPE